MLTRQALVLAPLLILAGVALAVPAGQETGPRDAQAILRQVRQVYENLTAHRFEHRIRIDQTPVDGAQESVADVTLTTVTQQTNAAGGRGQARAEGGGTPSGALLASTPPCRPVNRDLAEPVGNDFAASLRTLRSTLAILHPTNV